MSATTPFSGISSRNSRAARADRERVQRLDAVLETIVDRQEALLVRLLRGCAQAVVDAPLAQKFALREDFARMELDVMKECSALFDARRPRPRPRAGLIIPERFSASQAASSMLWKEAKREQDDDECLKADERRWRVAKAADNTAAVDAALEAVLASKAVVLAKPEVKKQLRGERNQRERAANTARCQCRVLACWERTVLASTAGSVVPQALSWQQRLDVMTAEQNERHQCPTAGATVLFHFASCRHVLQRRLRGVTSSCSIAWPRQ